MSCRWPTTASRAIGWDVGDNRAHVVSAGWLNTAPKAIDYSRRSSTCNATPWSLATAPKAIGESCSRQSSTCNVNVNASWLPTVPKVVCFNCARYYVHVVSALQPHALQHYLDKSSWLKSRMGDLIPYPNQLNTQNSFQAGRWPCRCLKKNKCQNDVAYGLQCWQLWWFPVASQFSIWVSDEYRPVKRIRWKIISRSTQHDA